MTASITKFVILSSSKVYYESYGHGNQALVFIHGWTCDSTLWYSQKPFYQKHRSLLIDLPGHGRSDAPEIDYHHEMFSQAIEAILDEEGVDNATMIAHSIGGPISQMLLRRDPKRINAIVFVDSFFRIPQHYLTIKEREDLAKRLKGDQFATYFDRFWTSATRKELRKTIVNVSMSTPEHVRISTVATNSLPHAYRGNETYNIPAIQIRRSTNPVDQLWHYHFPKLEVEVWEGHSHFLFMEDPERFNTTVEEFLKRHKLLGDMCE